MRTMGQALSITDVMKIQAVLNKEGYCSGPVDGVYGGRTRAAVMRLQKERNLAPNGRTDPETAAVLKRLTLGFEDYLTQPGDTLHAIARRYGTTSAAICAANPGLHSPAPGMRLAVPYGTQVVDTNVGYAYATLENDLAGLCVRYPFLRMTVAGNSVMGRKLYALRLGSGDNRVFYNAAHHAMEWLNAALLMKFAENYAKAYALGGTILGYDAAELWRLSSIYIMPMVNPDGVELSLNGLWPDNPYHSRLIGWNGGSTDFSHGWQANIRGVDLNHNYDAGWEQSKKAESEYGIAEPGPTRYSGTGPESEPESRAVADFTRANDFRLVLAYHSQGREIYRKYLDREPPDSGRIGELFAVTSGYALSEVSGIASFAGYKDWFIDKYNRPGYTIETGLGKNPLPLSQFDRIYRDNIEILLLAALV